MGWKVVLAVAALFALFGLLVGSCAPAPKPESALTPTAVDSDGDGWTDVQEQTAGTNPHNKDTDADGYWDPQDPNPLDPNIPAKAIPAPAPMPAPAPAPTPGPTPAPAPPPTIAPEKTGRTVAEQDKAEDCDTWASYLQGSSIQVIAVGQDCLWLGTNSGLIRFSKSGQEITLTYYDKDDGLSGIDIQTLKVYGDELWIGSRDGGLSRFDGSQFTNYGQEEGLFDSRVMAMDVDEESVWLGLCFGLSRFDKKTGTFHNFELPGGFVPQLGLGSAEGASADDPRRVYADSILIDGQHVWHGAWNAARSNRDLTESRDFLCGEIPESRIASICKLGSYIYIGTSGGLARVDTATLKVRNFKEEEGLSSNRILALAAGDRFLWIGTDLGIGRFDAESGQFTSFGQGYGQEVILCMAADGNYMWAGTTGGLTRRYKKAEEPRVSPVLHDFENSILTQRLWNVPRQQPIPVSGLTGIFTVDSTTGADGSQSSLCLTYELPPEPTRTADYYFCFSVLGTFSEDLAPYEGITFFTKAEGPLNNIYFLTASLVENAHRPEPDEAFGCHFKPVLGEWTRVVVPFTALSAPPLQATVNSILELRKVNAIRFEYAFKYWRPGEELKFWIDEISLYQRGEFEPTVPDQRTAVDRQK